MIDEFADLAEIFLGWDAYPKAAIVSFLVSTTDQNKTAWNNKSDAIYNAYSRAVVESNYPIWQPTDPTGSDRIVKEVSRSTGLSENDVYTYLLSLYTMAKMGKIETKYWNPKEGKALDNYGLSQVTESIKNMISPITDTAAAPMEKYAKWLLFAGILTAIGMVAAKSYINKKVI